MIAIFNHSINTKLIDLITSSFFINRKKKDNSKIDLKLRSIFYITDALSPINTEHKTEIKK